MHSLLLQAFVFAIPIVASVAAATAVSTVGPKPRTLWQFIAWWVVLTAVALLVLLVVDRLARKLLPLATLLKLSMLFPDRAPSRFRVARNAASVRKLSEQLTAARERGLTAEPVWAAETVLTLITALGHHDRRSRGHSERVHVYTELLAEELDLAEFDRDRLRWAALLHDVGKLVVPSELLNKPSRPDTEEWSALRRHPDAGAELCAPLLPWLGEWGHAIAEHHEWYDGTGYPRGLNGTQISRAARIVAVADCYEVMTTSRTYKRAMNPAAAREELARCAGTQFDPAIVRAFLNVSLGRLRLAMGPLAMLSTVPSMARLTALLEPLARAGAVIGGAAVIVSGSSLLPSDATARPAPPEPTAPRIATSDAAAAADAAPPAERAAVAAAEAGSRPERDDTEVAGVIETAAADPAPRKPRPDLKLRRERPADAPAKARAPKDERDDVTTPKGDETAAGPGVSAAPPANGNSNGSSHGDDDGDKAKAKGKDKPAPPRGPKPDAARPAGPRDGRPEHQPEAASDDEQQPAEDDARGADRDPRGAQPSAPPDEPPGQTEGHPDPGNPPPNPDPPGRRDDG